MAQNVRINGVTYSAVPSVKVPLSTGSGNATFYDTSDANVAQNTLLAGSTAYGANGKINGSLSVPTISQDATTKVLSIG